MEYKKMCELYQITMGQSPESYSYNEKKDGLPFFQGNADFGEKYPTERIWCNAPKKIAKKNDILISVRAPIGALNYADKDCCIGRGLASITIENTIERNYVFYLLKNKKNLLNSKGTGSTFKAISKNVLEEIEIPVITLDEQIKIVKNLDNIKSICNKRINQLKTLDSLIQARFVDLLQQTLTYKTFTPYSVIRRFSSVM